MLIRGAGHKCCSCKCPVDFDPGPFERQAVIDHCHVTFNIRGILCSQCNSAIGLLGDDYESVVNAANYLKWNIK